MGYVAAIVGIILSTIIYKRALIKYHMGVLDIAIKNKAFDNLKVDFEFSNWHAFASSLPWAIFLYFVYRINAPTEEVASVIYWCLWFLSFGINLMYFESKGYADAFRYHAERCNRYKRNFNELNGQVLVVMRTRYKSNGPDHLVLHASKIVVNQYMGFNVSTEVELGDYFVKVKDGKYPMSFEIQAALKSVIADVEHGFGFTVINPTSHTFDQKIQLEPFFGSPSNPSQILVEIKDVCNS